MKHKRRNKEKRKHSNVEFAARAIDKRGEEINNRLTVGHWEGDTIYSCIKSSGECLLTLIERRTGTEIILKIRNRSALSVKQAFDSIERTLGSTMFKRLFKSITFDNGVEFSDVKGLENSSLTKGHKNKTLLCTSILFFRKKKQ